MRSDKPESIDDTVGRIEREGAGALASYQLLALLGIVLDGPSRSASGLLHAVLDDPEGRCFALAREGRARVLAFRELHARCLSSRLRRADALEDSAAMREFVRARLRDVSNEVFAGVFLDGHLRLLAMERFFDGSFDGSTAQAGSLARRALRLDAVAIVTVEYRPSGYPEPGEDERALVRALFHALALVDVRLLDHLYVGRDQCVSFAECGFL